MGQKTEPLSTLTADECRIVLALMNPRDYDRVQTTIILVSDLLGVNRWNATRTLGSIRKKVKTQIRALEPPRDGRARKGPVKPPPARKRSSRPPGRPRELPGPDDPLPLDRAAARAEILRRVDMEVLSPEEGLELLNNL